MGVESEDAITLHVIYVQMNHIQRQIALAILAHNLFDHGVRIIAPATLLIAQRPHWRHRRVAGQIRIACQNLFHRGSVEKVVIHLAAFGPKPRALLR